MMYLIAEDELFHYGTPRRSGRYPWGSGEDPYQHGSGFLGAVNTMHKSGMSESEIAEALGMSIRDLRARKSVEKNNLRALNSDRAMALKEKGWSKSAISQELGVSMSTVTKLLAPQTKERAEATSNISDVLREKLDNGGYLDIGKGTETILGVSDTRLAASVKKLEDEGYTVHTMKVKQLGTGEMTTVKVLAPKGATKKDCFENRDSIEIPGAKSFDNGHTFVKISPNKEGISSKRLHVVYAEDGGTEKDGVIEIRPGVQDLSLGRSSYAQVRIAVDGTHYLKGMAMYSDDLPKGVDIQFNTNKKKGTPVLGSGDDSVLKKMKDDPDNPFKSTTAPPEMFKGKDGKLHKSAVNKVREEGDWDQWAKTLSSQVLSKQSVKLAREQLGKTRDAYKKDYDTINSLTNPVVKKKLLESFADQADSAAIYMKAAAMPRQRTQVILPLKHLKENEIYAPNFRDGEKVALIRYPHAGTFEIPEVVVNNRNAKSRRILGKAYDAVGVNAKVAERLSGADFDGDTVLVVPNNHGKIKSTPALAGLKNFSTSQYKMKQSDIKSGRKKVISPKQKQIEMGKVSNLITDMTLKGATASELARAVRHSMVVIDSEKHELDYKKSELDNDIKGLKKKYQSGGASTIVSRAKSPVYVNKRKPRSAAKGGPIDKRTGEKVYEETGESYVNKKTGQIVYKKDKLHRMETVRDARTLSTGLPMEEVYAAHANYLKTLARKARVSSTRLTPPKQSRSARKTYDSEYKSLKSKLNNAYRNKPLERKAQLIANARVKLQVDANPGMDHDEQKKIERRALAEARARVGANKSTVNITPKEWEAIQAGAISSNMLSEIMKNGDLDQIKEYSMPRVETTLSRAKITRAKSMKSSGNYTVAEIADALGVSVSTINRALA